jgi:hypothetical protein
VPDRFLGLKIKTPNISAEHLETIWLGRMLRKIAALPVPAG